MENSNSNPRTAALLKVGSAIGQSQVLASLAGRCSAAQAACLHRLRKSREYLQVTTCWREFCASHLCIDGRNADKIIRLWEEFGAPYFELAQLTPIPPDAFRTLAPSIRDGALHLDGEVIEFIPENSHRLTAAVAGFRRAAPSKPAPQLSPHQQLAALGERCDAVVADLQRFSRKERCGENWLQFTAILSRLSAALNRIELENGLR